MHQLLLEIFNSFSGLSSCAKLSETESAHCHNDHNDVQEAKTVDLQSRQAVLVDYSDQEGHN